MFFIGNNLYGITQKDRVCDLSHNDNGTHLARKLRKCVLTMCFQISVKNTKCQKLHLVHATLRQTTD